MNAVKERKENTWPQEFVRERAQQAARSYIEWKKEGGESEEKWFTISWIANFFEVPVGQVRYWLKNDCGDTARHIREMGETKE